MKYISFSLWGDNKVYTYGMIENVLLAREIYPGWTVRVHYNDTVPECIVTWLKQQDNVESVHHPGTVKKASNTLWRFEDLFSSDTVIVRDSDSRLNTREKAAVDEWLTSDKDFHIMRDHQHHTVPIAAGMFGTRNNVCNLLTFKNNTRNYNICPVDFIDGKTLMKNFTDQLRNEDNKYMIDQIFLYHYVYPSVILNTIVHASHNKYEPFAKEFPNTEYTGFVGEVITSTPTASKIVGDEETNFERNGQY
jgi:hypothetical protein